MIGLKEDRFYVNHLRVRFSLKAADVADVRNVVRYGYESLDALYDVDVVPTKNGKEIHFKKNCSRCEPTRMHRYIQKHFGITSKPMDGFFCAEVVVTCPEERTQT